MYTFFFKKKKNLQLVLYNVQEVFFFFEILLMTWQGFESAYRGTNRKVSSSKTVRPFLSMGPVLEEIMLPSATRPDRLDLHD